MMDTYYIVKVLIRKKGIQRIDSRLRSKSKIIALIGQLQFYLGTLLTNHVKCPENINETRFFDRRWFRSMGQM